MKTSRILFSNASTYAHPEPKAFDTWVNLVLSQQKCAGQVSIYLVDKEEGLTLNRQYRGKDYATNVLAFPSTKLNKRMPLLGDLVLCVPVIIEEASTQQKSLVDHFAHLTMHGTLHLLGFDHIETDDAQKMEQLEVLLLTQLGIANPYEDDKSLLTAEGESTSHG